MSTINDIAIAAMQRNEEVNPSSPIFWNLANEVYPLVLESLCEAALICGEPEQRNNTTPFTIPASTTFLANPAGAFAILRVEIDGLPLRKASVFDLDMENNAWQNDPAAAIPRHWFPMGLGNWGVHPQLLAPVQVILTTVGYPVTDTPPYTGAETILLPIEFNLGLESYVTCWSRLKEGSPEIDQGMASYEMFLAIMEELSNLALRKGSLRFSKTMGSISEVSPIQKK